MSILDEDLAVSNDSDFDDLFPTPDDTKPSEFDELVTVIDNDEYVTEDESKSKNTESRKKRGRPAKTDSKRVVVKEKNEEDATPMAHKKRGRPAKNQIEPDDNIVVEEESTIEKKGRGKRVSVDDFPPEALDKIFEEFSKRPVNDLAKELNISEKYLYKAISRMKELFEMSISTGDLTQEDYDEFIAPKFEEYQPKDKFEMFVQKKIKKIKK